MESFLGEAMYASLLHAGPSATNKKLGQEVCQVNSSDLLFTTGMAGASVFFLEILLLVLCFCDTSNLVFYYNTSLIRFVMRLTF